MVQIISKHYLNYYQMKKPKRELRFEFAPLNQTLNLYTFKFIKIKVFGIIGWNIVKFKRCSIQMASNLLEKSPSNHV